MSGPLDGVKVVEFSEIIAAPMAGMLLADLGAEVIKVEPPWGDPWRFVQSFLPSESRQFMAYNRGKRSLPLDLTRPHAKEILRSLILDTDVVLVNYRPDVVVRLGVDYASLAEVNPGIVYCDLTAYGREGPDSQRPGYDLVLQAMSGMIAAEGKLQQGVPQHIWSSPLIDTTSGFCMAWSVCAALFARERTGRGQRIETTLLGSALALLAMRFLQVDSLDIKHRSDLLTELTAMAEGSATYDVINETYQASHQPAPGNIYYRVYMAKDGALAVGCLSDPLRLRLLEALGLSDIRFDPGYDPNSQESLAFGQRLVAEAELMFRQKTVAEWLALLEARGIPVGPVRFVEDLTNDPQVQANGLAVQVEHLEAGKVTMVGPLAQFSDAGVAPTRASPALGQHTGEILEELGYSSDDIARLGEEGLFG